MNEIRSISIIGTGNVGWHLFKAFSEADITIKHIIARNSSEGLKMSTGTEATVLENLDQVKDEPDLYLICTQDFEINGLAKSLSSSEAIVAHTSGGSGLEVFKDKPNKFGVFYPLQTFTKDAKIDYSDLPFLLEASDPETMIALQGLAEKISGDFHMLDSQSRLKLHLAAVFACNFSNHMATIAHKLLEEMDLDMKIIKPLMDQTMKKLETMSPGDAQTGPAVRGDDDTMKRHLDLLAAEPELQEIYRKISMNIAKEDKENNE